MREYTHLSRIIGERESRQGARNDVNNHKDGNKTTTSLLIDNEVKSNQEIGREYTHLSRIINERESKQGANQYTEREQNGNKNGASGQIYPEAKPSEKAAEVVGFSRKTADKASAVVKAIDNLKKEGKTAQAEQVRKKLNTSVNGAYNQAKSEGILLAQREERSRGSQLLCR